MRADRREPARGRLGSRSPGAKAAQLVVDSAALPPADRVDQIVVVERQHVRDPAPLVERPSDPGPEHG
jgi:hypothetical protein